MMPVSLLMSLRTLHSNIQLLVSPSQPARQKRKPRETDDMSDVGPRKTTNRRQEDRKTEKTMQEERRAGQERHASKRYPQQHKKQELEVCVADTGQAGKIKGGQHCKACSHSKLRVT